MRQSFGEAGGCFEVKFFSVRAMGCIGVLKNMECDLSNFFRVGSFSSGFCQVDVAEAEEVV